MFVRRGQLPFLLCLLLASGCGRTKPGSEERPADGGTVAGEARSLLAAVELVPAESGGSGILVLVPDAARRANWDLFGIGEERPLSQAHSTGELFAAEPGRYRITEYGNRGYVWADDLPVEAGKTTRLNLGAIVVTTPPGTAAGSWDLWDATGATKIDQANDNGTAIPVPAGNFAIKEYYNDRFVFARDVQVEPGRTVEIDLGAIRVTTPEGTEKGSWDLFTAAGAERIDQANDIGAVIPVPPGTFVVKEYANDLFVWGCGVQVAAGVVSELPLGAIRVQIPAGEKLSWDLWSGETKIDQASSAGVAVPTPPGTFTVKRYASDEVLAAGVTVVAGEITDLAP